VPYGDRPWPCDRTSKALAWWTSCARCNRSKGCESMIVLEALNARPPVTRFFSDYKHGGEPASLANRRRSSACSRIACIAARGIKGRCEALRVDVALVSHIDDDHIAGMVAIDTPTGQTEGPGKVPTARHPALLVQWFSRDRRRRRLTAIAPVAKAASLAASQDNLSEIAAKFGIDTVAGQLVLASVDQGARPPRRHWHTGDSAERAHRSSQSRRRTPSSWGGRHQLSRATQDPS